MSIMNFCCARMIFAVQIKKKTKTVKQNFKCLAVFISPLQNMCFFYLFVYFILPVLHLKNVKCLTGKSFDFEITVWLLCCPVGWHWMYLSVRNQLHLPVSEQNPHISEETTYIFIDVFSSLWHSRKCYFGWNLSEIRANFITDCKRHIEMRAVLKSWKPTLGLWNGMNKEEVYFSFSQ